MHCGRRRAARRSRRSGGRCRSARGTVLPVEEEVRGPWNCRSPSAEVAGRRGSKAQASCCGSEPGQGNAPGRFGNSTLTPTEKRSLVSRSQVMWAVSKRRACRLVRVPRATVHSKNQADDQAALRRRIREIAFSHVSWGCPRICVQLRQDGLRVNRKRVHRLSRAEGLCMKRQKPRRNRSTSPRIPPPTSSCRNESWPMALL